MPSKNCDFYNFSKNCEKLQKSQFFPKLIKTSVRGGTRVKLIKASVRGGTRVSSKNCDFYNFSKDYEKLEKL